MDVVEKLVSLIGGAKNSLAFTGAGISTESGIPDFRSPSGVWSRHQPVMYDDFLRSREERIRYWQIRREIYRDFASAKPNDGHIALARLEQLGKIAAVVTQNIDGLHQDAGSREVIEIHGTARMIACVKCGKEWSPEEIVARLDAGEQAPECDECSGPLKSKTISFGQPMPEREMREALQWAMDSDVCLAIGSSLVVEPAASIPRTATQYGAALAIINMTETPLDSYADLVVREPIGRVLRAVAQALEKVDSATR